MLSNIVRYLLLLLSGIYRTAMAAVGFLSDFGPGRRSDYWSGDKEAIVPEPLDRTRLRKRRRARRKRAEAERAENEE